MAGLQAERTCSLELAQAFTKRTGQDRDGIPITIVEAGKEPRNFTCHFLGERERARGVVSTNFNFHEYLTSVLWMENDHHPSAQISSVLWTHRCSRFYPHSPFLSCQAGTHTRRPSSRIHMKKSFKSRNNAQLWGLLRRARAQTRGPPSGSSLANRSGKTKTVHL